MILKNNFPKQSFIVWGITFISFFIQNPCSAIKPSKISYDLSDELKIKNKFKTPHELAERLKEYATACLTGSNKEVVVDENDPDQTTKGLKAMAMLLKALIDGNDGFAQDKKAAVMHWFEKGEEPEEPAKTFFGPFKKPGKSDTEVRERLAKMAQVVFAFAVQELNNKVLKKKGQYKGAWNVLMYAMKPENITRRTVYTATALLDAIRSVLYPWGTQEKSRNRNPDWESQKSMSDEVNQLYLDLTEGNEKLLSNDNSFMMRPEVQEDIELNILPLVTPQVEAEAKEKPMSTYAKLKAKFTGKSSKESSKRKPPVQEEED